MKHITIVRVIVAIVLALIVGKWDQIVAWDHARHIERIVTHCGYTGKIDVNVPFCKFELGDLTEKEIAEAKVLLEKQKAERLEARRKREMAYAETLKQN